MSMPYDSAPINLAISFSNVTQFGFRVTVSSGWVSGRYYCVYIFDANSVFTGLTAYFPMGSQYVDIYCPPVGDKAHPAWGPSTSLKIVAWCYTAVGEGRSPETSVTFAAANLAGTPTLTSQNFGATTDSLLPMSCATVAGATHYDWILTDGAGTILSTTSSPSFNYVPNNPNKKSYNIVVKARIGTSQCANVSSMQTYYIAPSVSGTSLETATLSGGGETMSTDYASLYYIPASTLSGVTRSAVAIAEDTTEYTGTIDVYETKDRFNFSLPIGHRYALVVRESNPAGHVDSLPKYFRARPMSCTTMTTNAVSAGSVAVTWDSVVSADRYKITVYTTTSKFVSQTSIEGTGTTSATIGNLSGHATSYRIVVQANNTHATEIGGDSPSAIYQTVTLSADPIAPSSLVVNNLTKNSFVLSWTLSDGACGYRIAGAPSDINVAAPPATIDSLSPATTYNMTIAPLAGGLFPGTWVGQASTPLPVTTLMDVVSVPATVSASAANGIIKIAFDRSANATAYRIYYKQHVDGDYDGTGLHLFGQAPSNGFVAIEATSPLLDVTNPDRPVVSLYGAVPDVPYYFGVMPTNGESFGDVTTYVDPVTLTMLPISNVFVADMGGYIRLSWQKDPSDTGTVAYQIFYENTYGANDGNHLKLSPEGDALPSPFIVIADMLSDPSNPFIDLYGAIGSTTYWFYVKPQDAQGSGGEAVPANRNFVPTSGVASKPEMMVAPGRIVVAVNQATKQINLSWE